jgi:hypothetical protein
VAELALDQGKRGSLRSGARRRARGAFGADLALAVVLAVDPAAIADLVGEAIVSRRFWVLPHPEFVELAVRRWHRIAEGLDPDTAVDVPGFPPAAQIASQIQAVLTAPTA